ncbi:hypothetical protein MCOR25_007003 [Pyricularia grisea]|nr:hypothetical protein MCOR25_007003 [Pyricularia grisea]
MHSLLITSLFFFSGVFALSEPPLIETGNGIKDGGNSSIMIIISSNSTINSTQTSTQTATSNSININISTSTSTTVPSTAINNPSTATSDSPKPDPSDIFRPPNPELFKPPGPDETCRTPTGGLLSPGVHCYCEGHTAYNNMVDMAIEEACDSWHNITLYRSEQIAYVKRLSSFKPVYLWMVNNCVRERREAVVDGEKCKQAMQVVRKKCQWPFWNQRGGHVTMNLDYEIGQEPDKCIMARFDIEAL